MGNRAHIVVQAKGQQDIVFYGHWSGDDNLTAVRNVLERTGRIGDTSYLTAQLFWEFATLGQYDGELGFGISTCEKFDEANEWTNVPTVFVDADTGEYTIEGETHKEFARL